jgi:hypothetical protein
MNIERPKTYITVLFCIFWFNAKIRKAGGETYELTPNWADKYQIKTLFIVLITDYLFVNSQSPKIN